MIYIMKRDIYKECIFDRDMKRHLHRTSNSTGSVITHSRYHTLSIPILAMLSITTTIHLAHPNIYGLT